MKGLLILSAVLVGLVALAIGFVALVRRDFASDFLLMKAYPLLVFVALFPLLLDFERRGWWRSFFAQFPPVVSALMGTLFTVVLALFAVLVLYGGVW
ncbi:MAG: hypothetical protein AAGK14_13135 [Verrucomicrobiota bacterium]